MDSNNNDDLPLQTSFKEFKKKKLYLTEKLGDVYQDGIQSLKRKQKHTNDPRFDPRVNGICYLSDWDFLKDERAKILKKLKKMLRTNSDSDKVKEISEALRLVRQRMATEKDRKFRKQFMDKIQKEQIENLESGKSVRFVPRAELRKLVQKERLAQMSKRQKERYLNRRKRKFVSNDT
uniref:rRNA biogenesis protein RRP36 n=1 Tax=Schistosoma japonicum TaxID=6182 RepID=Q5DFG8_SCHJA|nr:SJCHGC07065 protein [Schistosoma japonicum]